MNDQNIYISSLNNLLTSRKEKNPNYSLRALSRDISIDNSYLVKILKGKKSVSLNVAYKVANHLNLKGDQLAEFLSPFLQ